MFVSKRFCRTFQIKFALILLLVFMVAACTVSACTDNDGDGFNQTEADPACGPPWDCDDGSANVMPPRNDLYITTSTVLCPGIYNISDTGKQGIVIINGNSLTLTCNNTIINVTSDSASEIAILGNRTDHITVTGCTVYNSTTGIYFNSTNYSAISNFTYAYGNKSRTMCAVYLNSSNNNSVSSISVANSTLKSALSGLSLYQSCYNNISYSSINNNTATGISRSLSLSSNNNLSHFSTTNNTVGSSGTLDNLYGASSNYNSFTYFNTADNWVYYRLYGGVHMDPTCSNNNASSFTIANNTVLVNDFHGFGIQTNCYNNSASYFNITNNTIGNRLFAAYAFSSVNNTFHSFIIDGNTLTGSNSLRGLYLNWGANNNTVFSFTITNTIGRISAIGIVDGGVYDNNIYNFTIANNTANASNVVGASISYGSNNNISYITIINNTVVSTYGVIVSPAVASYIANNNTHSHFIIANNTAENIYGIILQATPLSSSSFNNTFTSFTVTNNTATSTYYGAYLYGNSDNNTIRDSNFTEASSALYGIYLNNSGTDNPDNNNITGVIVSGAFSYGAVINTTGATGNLIWNNNLTATIPAYDDSTAGNTWSVAQQTGPNIIGGQDIGGNYYSDYAGFDTDSDGIGETLVPYSVAGGIAQDALPLTNLLCIDSDADGYYTQGGLCGAVDCDDTNRHTYPDAPEFCGDGVDQNCDGSDDECKEKHEKASPMYILVPPDELPTYKQPKTTPPVTQPLTIETKNLIVIVPREAHEGEQITIVVTDVLGNPVPGVIVAIDDKEAMTGVDGRANFDDLTAGVKTVLATKSGYADATENFRINVKEQPTKTSESATTLGYAMNAGRGHDWGMPWAIIGAIIIAIAVAFFAYSKRRG